MCTSRIFIVAVAAMGLPSGEGVRTAKRVTADVTDLKCFWKRETCESECGNFGCVRSRKCLHRGPYKCSETAEAEIEKERVVEETRKEAARVDREKKETLAREAEAKAERAKAARDARIEEERVAEETRADAARVADAALVAEAEAKRVAEAALVAAAKAERVADEAPVTDAAPVDREAEEQAATAREAEGETEVENDASDAETDVRGDVGVESEQEAGGEPHDEHEEHLADDADRAKKVKIEPAAKDAASDEE